MTTRYITTPIYYLNAAPHLGHVYTTVAGDMMARYWRLQGAKVKFLTGTDEHGQKIAQAAEAAGKDPKFHVDEMAEVFRDMTSAINATPDVFIRTTEDRHYKAAQALWDKLIASGDIYLGAYSGWYAVRDEAYYDESEIVDGKAPTGAPVEWVEQPSYFFRLSKWESALLKHYEAFPQAIAPLSRHNEVISFIKGGLKDLSISRTNFTWGVPVPGDKDHVMYVWMDALTNYITALGYPDTNSPEFQEFWPESIHLMGKDILRFHAVYWPAFLMAAGIQPPKRIFAHGWWTADSQKMSKSLGNVVDPFKLIEKYGLDQMRFFLMREVPFGQDGDYSDHAMISRINSNLANDLGNLVQRVLSFIQKNAGAKVPEPGEFSEQDREMLAGASHLHDVLMDDMNQQMLHKYCEHVGEVVVKANRYIDQQKPWSLNKSENPQDKKRMETILYVLLEVIRHVGTYYQPVMPQTMEKLLGLLGLQNVTFTDLKTPLKSGTPLPAPAPLFPRIEVEAA